MELLPCPFCGNKEPSLSFTKPDPDGLYDFDTCCYMCHQCDAQSGGVLINCRDPDSDENIKAEAVEVWNTRATARNTDDEAGPHVAAGGGDYDAG